MTRINSVILSRRIPNAELGILFNARPLFNIERQQPIVLSVTGFINGQREWLDWGNRTVMTFIRMEV